MKERVKADDMYKELPGLKKEDVWEIQQWIRENPEFPKTSEELVIRMIYATRFDLDMAKEYIRNYYTFRLYTFAEGFSRRDVLLQELQIQMDVLYTAVVPKNDPKGNIIIVQSLKVTDPTAYELLTAVKLSCMLIDAVLCKEGVPKGIIMLFDSKGVSFKHIFRLKLAYAKLACQYIQKGCPIRLTEIHVVNKLPVLTALLLLLKPFLDKDIYNKLYFHSGNYAEVQKFIPLECLPSDYGGAQPSVEQSHEEYKKLMFELRDQFIKDDEEDKKFVEMRKKAELKDSTSKNSRLFF